MNTTNISIHNVTSIVLGDRRLLCADTDNPFYTRDIVITNNRGESVNITLFSVHDADEDTGLKVLS